MKQILVSESALDTLTQQFDELQRERDELAKDAYKWRWLRDNNWRGFGVRTENDTLDDAIEAAMSIDKCKI